MQANLSPKVVAIVLAVVILAAGLFFWKGTSGDRNEDIKMKMLNAGLGQQAVPARK